MQHKKLSYKHASMLMTVQSFPRDICIYWEWMVLVIL